MKAKSSLKILGLFSSIAFFAGIGIGGIGSWPLNLRGNASQEGGIVIKPLEVSFGAISDSALVGPGGFVCRMGNAVSKRFVANGQLQLGAETFSIVGVCEHNGSDLVEVVAQQRVAGVVKTVNVTGNAQSSGETTVVNGRAFITNQPSLVYSINLEGVTPQ